MKTPVPEIDDYLSVNIVNNLHMLLMGTIFFGSSPAFFWISEPWRLSLRYDGIGKATGNSVLWERFRKKRNLA